MPIKLSFSLVFCIIAALSFISCRNNDSGVAREPSYVGHIVGIQNQKVYPKRINVDNGIITSIDPLENVDENVPYYLPGMIFYTAANPYETSKADIYNTDLGVWMSNRFTSTLIESLSSKSVISLRDLYNRLFIDTVGSHVMVYNADNYGNLYNSSMDEFINL